MPRRAQTSTPPKPAVDILANATNSSSRPGWIGGVAGEISGLGVAAGGDSKTMGQNLEQRRGRGQPNSACSRPLSTPVGPLCFRRFAPYIEAAGSPAMEINCRRNKPFGPGGGTRRLHQNPNQSWLTGFGGGETGSTRA